MIDTAQYNRPSIFSLALCFFNRVVVVCVCFSALSLVNIRNPLLLFRSFSNSTTDFEKATSYFPTELCSPRRTYFLSSRISFTVFNFSSFRNEFIFRLLPPQKAYNAHITSHSEGHGFCDSKKRDAYCGLSACDCYVFSLLLFFLHCFLVDNTFCCSCFSISIQNNIFNYYFLNGRN